MGCLLDTSRGDGFPREPRAARSARFGRTPGGDTSGMDIATLARSQAFNRLALGTALIVLPGLFGRVWAGSTASDERAHVLARALGARDIALGAAGLLALQDADAEWARRSFAAQAFVDAVDLAAIAAAGERLPPASRIVGGAMAAGSACVALAYAARLAGGTAETGDVAA